ncbi:MAG: extracellular solute-binding protein [Thermomicrobiales bacterium]|nr:extracellular solute-binding protein [Thermomicrobiales bacterium]
MRKNETIEKFGGTERRLTRRTALKTGAAIAAAFAVAPALGARAAQDAGTPAADAETWGQYKDKGIQINFLSEDTPPTAAMINHVGEFEELTGITVNITQTGLADVVTKVLLDFASQAGDIDVIYADPMQIMAPLYGNFTDLRTFIDDPTLPALPNGLDDFDKMNLIGSGYMIDREKLLAIPYDAPTMLLAYRTDIFENATYKDLFQQEKGYDWTPGPNITWEQYREIAEWINGKVADGTIAEKVAGTGHQAKQYDSLMCDFSNVMLAEGGNYFDNPDYATWGTATPGGCALGSPEALAAAKLYDSILKQAAPGSLSWDWNGLAEAFSAGGIAMAPEWHEYASMFEDENLSTVAGHVKWALLPKGPNGTKNLWGGTGLAVNSYGTEERQRAAWLFINWATSPETQKKLLLEGSTPTRTSVYQDAEVQQWIADNKDPLVAVLPTVLDAWKPENIGLAQGKIVTWVQVDEAIFTDLSKMLTGSKTPEQAMTDAVSTIDKINNWPPAGA